MNRKLLIATLLSTLAVIPLALIWVFFGLIIDSSPSFLAIINEALMQIITFMPITFLFVLLVLIPAYFIFKRLKLQHIISYLIVGALIPTSITMVLFWRQILNSVLTEKLFYFSVPFFYGLVISLIFYYLAVKKFETKS